MKSLTTIEEKYSHEKQIRPIYSGEDLRIVGANPGITFLRLSNLLTHKTFHTHSALLMESLNSAPHKKISPE